MPAEPTSSYLPLLIVVLLAFLVPLVVSHIKRIKIPVVVGEIFAGIIIGRSGLNLVPEDAWLDVLSTLGFAMLMFLAGLEIDFELILSQFRSRARGYKWLLRNPLGIGAAIFGITLGTSWLISAGLTLFGLIPSPWLMALILSTTSLGIVVPVLKEQGLLNCDTGQTILLSAIIADFATMLLISVYVAFVTKGFTPEVLLVLVLLLAFVLVYRVAAFSRKHLPFERLFQNISHATAQIEMRGAFAIGLIFIELAEALHIEIILGAFLGGMIISLLSEHGSVLRTKLEAFGYSFFIPIFFIMVGVRFEIGALFSSPNALILLPLLLIIVYVVKIVPSLVYPRACSLRENIATGVLLSSRLSLIIAAAEIGRALNVIDAAIYTDVIIIALLTCTISPIAFNRLMPGRTEPTRLALILGAGQRARLLARQLKRDNYEIAIVGHDTETCHLTKELALGVTLCGACTEPETLRAAGIEHAAAVVAMLPDDEDNLVACQLAKQLFQIERVVARVIDPKYRPQYAELGVRTTNEMWAHIAMLENLVRNPNIFDLITHVDEGREVQEAQLRHAAWAGKTISELKLPSDVLIVMIKRGEAIIVPHGITKLQLGDIITLAGDEEQVELTAQALCGGESL